MTKRPFPSYLHHPVPDPGHTSPGVHVKVSNVFSFQKDLREQPVDADGLSWTLTSGFLGVCLSTSYITSLCLSLLICKLKILVIPTSWAS